MVCDIKTKRLVKNTMFLYIMTFVKLVLPLITLPYLTRVLSKDAYGVVSYVKSCMAYVQLIIDCGFILSATKEVVEIFNSGDADVNKKLGRVVGNVYAAKLSLMMVRCV